MIRSKLCLLVALAAAITHTASAAPNPIESELFPPEFLQANAAVLEISETQMNEVKEIMTGAQPRFESFRSDMESRMIALRDALQKETPDAAAVEEKLRAVVGLEADVKALQMRTMLAVRAKLNATQVSKARELRQKQLSAQGDTTRDRLREKFERMKALVEKEIQSGKDAAPYVERGEKIKAVAGAGKMKEAEAMLDETIASLSEKK